MNEQELSPIERYRANWKPDKKLIAKYKAAYRKAVRDNDYVRMGIYSMALRDAQRPPSNLPIKNLTVTEPQEDK